MAIVAGGRCVVRAFSPAVKLVAHDVAIHAGGRIVGEVAGALGVVEREDADAQRESQARRDEPSIRRETRPHSHEHSPITRAPTWPIIPTRHWPPTTHRFPLP